MLIGFVTSANEHLFTAFVFIISEKGLLHQFQLLSVSVVWYWRRNVAIVKLGPRGLPRTNERGAV